MDSEPLILERKGPVARVILNRPNAGNAIELSLARALMEASIACDEDSSIRCVVLTGAGNLFCAGGDVGAFAEAGDNAPALIKQLTAYVHMAVARFARMGKPLVTSINGPAAEAGVSLALLGDIALCANTANFRIAYSSLGLSPDAGLSWLLPRLVGLRRAQELLLVDRRVTADEAAAIGMVTKVVDADKLHEETEATAARLAESSVSALGRARNLVLESYSASLETHMENEARTMADAARNAAFREGIAAFAQKRKPNFSS